MKKVTILAVLALLMMPLFSQAMEQKRKLKLETKSQNSDEPRRKKRRIVGAESQSQQENNSMVLLDPGWNGCPPEIQMHILYFVLDPNIVTSAIARKEKKAIFQFIRQWRTLLSVGKAINSFALDSQVIKIEEINGNVLEKFPDCFRDLIRKATSKCDYLFQLPLSVAFPTIEQSSVDLLIIASSQKRFKFCEELLKAGVLEGAQNISLIHAIFFRDEDVVKKLIGYGRDKALIKNDINQLMMAAGIGDIAILKLLLDAKPDDLSLKSQKGETVLMYAAYNGHQEMVDLLLAKGVAIDHKDIYGFTALTFASIQGYKHVVKFLLTNGATADQPDIKGKTPLMFAAENGHKEVVELLLAKGVAIDYKDIYGRTATMYGANNGYEGIVELLVAKGAVVDQKDNKGISVLMIAAGRGYKGIGTLFLEKGSAVDQQSNNGLTPLMLAACAGQKNVAKMFLKKGADINKRSTLGWTTLMFAAHKGHKDMVVMLLRKGAIVQQDNVVGSALLEAQSHGHMRIVEILQNHLDSK